MGENIDSRLVQNSAPAPCKHMSLEDVRSLKKEERYAQRDDNIGETRPLSNERVCGKSKGPGGGGGGALVAPRPREDFVGFLKLDDTIWYFLYFHFHRPMTLYPPLSGKPCRGYMSDSQVIGGIKAEAMSMVYILHFNRSLRLSKGITYKSTFTKVISTLVTANLIKVISRSLPSVETVYHI